MPDLFHFARFTDAVHGTYGISELESDIISTPVFQRLHNVRQLGLAHLVYPGAEYSRFAHSLGACHVAGRMLKGITQNCTRDFSNNDIQMYRLAGLLHDLGHYPFSHAMEHAIQDHYKQKAFLIGDAANPNEVSDIAEPPSYNHEQLGKAVLELDRDIARVLKKHGVLAEDLKAVLSRYPSAGGRLSLMSILGIAFLRVAR